MNRILIVDDQACVRALIRAQLTLDGYCVTDLGDIGSVRRYLSSAKPDLITLDLFLDGEEGFSLLPDIKRRYPEVPVIVLTAYDGFRDDSRLALADGYLIKSFDFEGLRRAIRQLLSKQPTDEPVPVECCASAV